MSSRQPSHFLLLRQKKVTKEKATPLRVTLRSNTRGPDPRKAPLLGTRRGEWDGPSLRSAGNGLAARGPAPVRAHEHEHVHVHVHVQVRECECECECEHKHGHDRKRGPGAHASLHATEGRAMARWN